MMYNQQGKKSAKNAQKAATGAAFVFFIYMTAS